MDFLQLAKDRYSCKSFSGEALEKEKLDKILEAGNLAPTAKNLQGQRIYVVQSEEGLAKFDELTPCRYEAPTVLMVAINTEETFTYPGDKYDSGLEDISIVASHMVLAAASMGVDSCWVNFFDPDKAKEAFDLPENEIPYILIDLGYAEEGTEPKANHFSRKDLEETVKYI